MTKEAFLTALQGRLAGLPRADMEERLSFYEEMIDDRMEDGLAEEAAVAGIGSVEEVAAQITAQTPLVKLVKERVRPKRRLRAWEIVLLILGAPVWLPLLLAAAAICLSIYITVWSLVLSLYAVNLSFAAAGLGSVAVAAGYLLNRQPAQAGCVFGIGLLLMGLALLFLPVSIAATRGMVRGTKNLILGLKARFMRKEAAV